jgi:hypothetical protein
MRKIFIMALLLVSTLAVRAQMFVSPYLPEDMEGLSDNNLSLLENRLAQIINQNGMVSADDTRFILTLNWNILDKEIVGSAPTVIVYQLEVSVAFGDGMTGTKYASTSFTLKGAGNNEAKAILNAMKGINGHKDEISQMLRKGSQRVSEYYESNKKDILNMAKSMISQGQYDACMVELAQVPEGTSYYTEAQAMLAKAYKGYVNQNAAQQLQEARAAWAASPTRENAEDVMALVADIDASSSSYSGAQALIKEVNSRVTRLDNEDRAEETRITEHLLGMDTARNRAARKVATKSAKSGSAKGKTAGGKTKSYNKAAIKGWY